MSTQIADGSKKFLKNILSLTKLNDKEIATGFYSKK